jgi:two-component system heavy metal sensor histidine kinase CusS
MQQGVVRERRPLFTLSISARLAIAYTLSAFIMLAIITFIQYRILIQGLEWDETQIVLDKIKMFEATLRIHGDNHAFLDHEVNLEGGEYWPGQQYSIYSRILDDTGSTIIETEGMEQLIPTSSFPQPMKTEQEWDEAAVHYREASNGRSYFLKSAWARSGSVDGPRRLIQVAMDETGERAMIAGYQRNTFLALILGTLLFAFLGTFITRRCMRPVRDLAKTAERITANNVMSGIDTNAARWPGELTMLAGAFYHMLSRINYSYKRCSQCAEDIAHELRNPIQSLMGEAEVALSRERTPEEYRQVLESSLEEYVRLSRMINELLFLARADNPNTAIERERLDIRSELDAVREFHETQAHEQGVTISVTGQASLDADPQLLRRAISNLVSNALSHTPEGGFIRLEISKTRAGSIVEVVVRDNGCGIKEGELPRIFDRFYCTGHKKILPDQGAGLGLAIVKSIITLHGGSIGIDSIEGEGTTVVLRFPACESCRRDLELPLSEIVSGEPVNV